MTILSRGQVFLAKALADTQNCHPDAPASPPSLMILTDLGGAI